MLVGAVNERIVSDLGHSLRDGDAREGAAGSERVFTDGGQAVWDGNVRE